MGQQDMLARLLRGNPDPSLPGYPVMQSSENRGFKPIPFQGEGFQRMAAVLRGDVEPTPGEQMGMNVVRGFTEGPATIRAFHGSPHKFDRFDMSRIGTGEGAQAYGHGLYFAGNEGVARSYRDQLAGLAGPVVFRGQRMPVGDVDHAIMTAGRNAGASIPQGRLDFFSTNLVEAARNGHSLDEIVALAKTPTERAAADAMLRVARDVAPSPSGSMYEVNLNTTPDRLLDWDAPLPANHPARELLYDVARPASETVYGDSRSRAFEALRQSRNLNLTGEGLHNQISRLMGDRPQASEALRERGIPGIQYLDAGSRAAGDGTRNYVMFDDKLIDILRRYGIAGTLGGGAAATSGTSE
jgi:hypothetical protein